MIYPKSLAKGGKIGVTATSDGNHKDIDFIRLDRAAYNFKQIGYRVEETSNVRTSIKGRSSDGRTRAKQLMELFDDKDISVIMAAGGGDFLVEMLPYVDFNMIKANPKWVQGYSDTTGLTFTITTNLDIATLYANNYSTFGMKDWHSSLCDNVKILEGFDITQDSGEGFQDGFIEKVTGLEGFALDANVCWRNIQSGLSEQNKEEDEIKIKGRALGGCLDVLLNLVGTRYDRTCDYVSRYKDDGILWYLESYNLGSEALTRGLWQLKEAGWFNHAVGFVFGRPAMFSTYTDTTYEEVVLSVLKEFDLPIIIDADIGHKPPQFTIINGAMATVTSSAGRGCIRFARK